MHCTLRSLTSPGLIHRTRCPSARPCRCLQTNATNRRNRPKSSWPTPHLRASASVRPNAAPSATRRASPACGPSSRRSRWRIAAGDKAAARRRCGSAQPEMQRAAIKGVMHKNTVARKLSRLSARIKALACRRERPARGGHPPGDAGNKINIHLKSRSQFRLRLIS